MAMYSIRLVRDRDVPGERRSRLEFAGSAVWAVFLVLVVAGVDFGLVRQTWNSIKLDRQQAVEQAVGDARDVMALITSVYDAAIQGNTQNDAFAVEAAGAEKDLLQRHASGDFDHYEIGTVQLPDFHTWPASPRDQQKYTVTALVDVWELSSAGATGPPYQYTLLYRVTSFRDYGNASIGGAEWQIEDVVRTQ